MEQSLNGDPFDNIAYEIWNQDDHLPASCWSLAACEYEAEAAVSCSSKEGFPRLWTCQDSGSSSCPKAGSSHLHFCPKEWSGSSSGCINLSRRIANSLLAPAHHCHSLLSIQKCAAHTCSLPSDKRQRIVAPQRLLACAQADVKDRDGLIFRKIFSPDENDRSLPTHLVAYKNELIVQLDLMGHECGPNLRKRFFSLFEMLRYSVRNSCPSISMQLWPWKNTCLTALHLFFQHAAGGSTL